MRPAKIFIEAESDSTVSFGFVAWKSNNTVTLYLSAQGGEKIEFYSGLERIKNDDQDNLLVLEKSKIQTTLDVPKGTVITARLHDVDCDWWDEEDPSRTFIL